MTFSRLHLQRMSSPFLVRSVIRARDKIVAQMADDMRVIETRRGYVDAEDLELLGWLPQQINSCGADARRTALRESVRQRRAA